MLVVMGGPSGCGKSYVAAMVGQLGAEVVSRDFIRFSLLGEGEDYFAHEKDVERNFYNNISSALENKDAVVVADATHLNPKSRRKLFQRISNTDGHKIVGIWVEGTPSKAKVFNSERVGLARVPQNVIDLQFKARLSPSIEEGFDDIIFVSPPAEDDDQRLVNSINQYQVRPLTLKSLARLLGMEEK